jgi:hypothetical protein
MLPQMPARPQIRRHRPLRRFRHPNSPRCFPTGLHSASPARSHPIPAAPMLPAPQITQLPQQAPVMSQMSPAPARSRHRPTSTTGDRAAAHVQPGLSAAAACPTFNANGLAPNLGAYRPAPQMPGYASQGPAARSAPHPQAPQLPSFANPFSGPQFGGAGGLMAGPTYDTGPPMQQPYDEPLFARLLMPRQRLNIKETRWAFPNPSRPRRRTRPEPDRHHHARNPGMGDGLADGLYRRIGSMLDADPNSFVAGGLPAPAAGMGQCRSLGLLDRQQQRRLATSR